MSNQIILGKPTRKVQNSFLETIGMKLVDSVEDIDIAEYDDSKFLMFIENDEYPIVLNNSPKNLTNEWLRSSGVDLSTVTDIRYSSSTETLEPYAFTGCTQLSAIKRPTDCNLLSAFENCLSGCDNIEVFEADFSKLTWHTQMFSSCKLKQVNLKSVSEDYEELFNILGYTVRSDESQRSLLKATVNDDGSTTAWKTMYDAELEHPENFTFKQLNPDGSLKPVEDHEYEEGSKELENEIDPNEICKVEDIEHEEILDNPCTPEDEHEDAWTEHIEYKHAFHSEVIHNTHQSDMCVACVKTVIPITNPRDLTRDDMLNLQIPTLDMPTGTVFGYRVAMTYIIEHCQTETYSVYQKCSRCGKEASTMYEKLKTNYEFQTTVTTEKEASSDIAPEDNKSGSGWIECEETSENKQSDGYTSTKKKKKPDTQGKN